MRKAVDSKSGAGQGRAKGPFAALVGDVMLWVVAFKRSSLPGAVGPGFRPSGGAHANPPAAALLTGQAARERASALKRLRLVRSFLVGTHNPKLSIVMPRSQPGSPYDWDLRRKSLESEVVHHSALSSAERSQAGLNLLAFMD